MGQLTNEPYINHFSHPHPLQLCNADTHHIPPCSACSLEASGWMYGCVQCSFILHISCSQLPTLITHPAHHIHHLSLLPTPPYPSGSFNCDACGRHGKGFSYHCTHCGFDIHTTCSTKPLTVSHQSHPHQLALTFQPPYHVNSFSCDICGLVGYNHWLYRCGPCNFDAHMECATGTASLPSTQTQLQHSRSLPAPNQFQQPGGMNAYMHTQSLGARQVGYQQPVVGMQVRYQQPQSYYQQPLGTRQAGYQEPPAPAGAGNTLKDTMVQGFVDGAAQQVGQTFIQSIMGDNGNNSSNSDGGNSSAPSIINIGSSLLSGIFGDSSS